MKTLIKIITLLIGVNVFAKIALFGITQHQNVAEIVHKMRIVKATKTAMLKEMKMVMVVMDNVHAILTLNGMMECNGVYETAHLMKTLIPLIILLIWLNVLAKMASYGTIQHLHV
jgi:hypothetical protein